MKLTTGESPAPKMTEVNKKLAGTKVDAGTQETHRRQPLIQKSVEGGRQSLVRRPSQSAIHKHVDQDD